MEKYRYFVFLLLSRDERGDVLKITSTTLIRPSDVFNYVKLSLSLTWGRWEADFAFFRKRSQDWHSTWFTRIPLGLECHPTNISFPIVCAIYTFLKCGISLDLPNVRKRNIPWSLFKLKSYCLSIDPWKGTTPRPNHCTKISIAVSKIKVSIFLRLCPNCQALLQLWPSCCWDIVKLFLSFGRAHKAWRENIAK